MMMMMTSAIYSEGQLYTYAVRCNTGELARRTFAACSVIVAIANTPSTYTSSSLLTYTLPRQFLDVRVAVASTKIKTDYANYKLSNSSIRYDKVKIEHCSREKHNVTQLK